MPNSYIKKLADEGKGSIEELEKKWDKAKTLAADEGHEEEYDYITGIFKKMIGESFTDEEGEKLAWSLFMESMNKVPYKVNQILKGLQKRGFNMRSPKTGNMAGETVWTFVHSQTNDQLDISWFPDDDSMKYTYSGINKRGHGWMDVSDLQKTLNRVIKQEMMIEEGEPTQSVTTGHVALHSTPTSIVRKRPNKMCDCGSEHYKMVTDSTSNPVWQCGSCGITSARQVRTTPQKKRFRDLMNGLMPMEEAKEQYQIYHKSFSNAMDAVSKYIEKRGYSYDDDEWFRVVSNGPKKPSEGKTNRYKLPLTKNDKETKKEAVFQVYGMKDKYELNLYIS